MCRSSLLLAAALVAAPSLAAAQSSSQPPPTQEATVDPPPQRAFLEDPPLLATAISRIEKFRGNPDTRPKDGFYLELGHMITGGGWISLGPGYRRHLWSGRALAEASAALSWRTYKIAQTRFELPYLADNRLAIGSKVLWQDFTQVRYYGIGPESSNASVSDYRLKTTDFIGYLTWHPRSQLEVRGTIGVLKRPRISSSTGLFDRDEPDTFRLFAEDPGASRPRQPGFAHSELALAFDRRDSAGHPTRGDLYRAAWATYRDREGGHFSFDRWELHAARFARVVRNRGVLAVRFWTLLSHTAEGREIPFYLMPGLGGHNTIRAYDDYRFHDRHLMVVNAESRWALFPHVDTALFFDAGNVAARVKDLDFGRRSIGAGARLHTGGFTLARFDVTRGEEGWRFVLKLTDPLRLSSEVRRTAAIPFVP